MGCNSSKKVNPVIRKAKRNQSKNTIREVRIDFDTFISRRSGKITDVYDILEKIGSGGFGYINLAVHKTSNQRRAIKTFPKTALSSDSTSRTRFFAELDTLRALDHPNIVKILSLIHI